MLYMKSTSANDGSYRLTVSFALGTNADTDTVNVNNRVQTALPQLPQEIQRQGYHRPASNPLRSCSSSVSPATKHDSLFIANYITINVLDENLAHSWRRPGAAFRAPEVFDARCGTTSQRLNSLNVSPSDVAAAHRGAERAGADRPHRRARR